MPHLAKTIKPLRTLMQEAAIDAVEQLGVMGAAKALGTSAKRVKRLLLEAGDQTDYRTVRAARERSKAR